MADRDLYQFSSFLAEEQGNGSWCFSYDTCTFRYSPCDDSELHPDLHYNDASATWVLIAAIIVFFMKAGFMLLELSFAKNVKEKRNVVIIKHQDAFASAFGFFLLGYYWITRHHSPQNIRQKFFRVADPLISFFNFTFASNAATIVGGCLVTSKYKMRLPAAFISAFVISGILHPAATRIFWSDECRSLSPYRFCDYPHPGISSHACGHNCSSSMGLWERLYVLDFSGGGVVHLLGGVAGLMLCLFAKLREWRDKRIKEHNCEHHSYAGAEQGEERNPQGFWDWMYPVHGGDETVSEAALGVIILWFCWFAFNCGSTESIELGRPLRNYTGPQEYPYYGIPAVIAINMILAVATGGTTAVIIAVWAQIRYRAESVSANEIANGILSSLVAITAGCAFVDYWGACVIGLFAVLLYHGGCYLEYKLGIKDTARVVPVHGVCGLWSLIAVAIFQIGTDADCNLHAAFEGLCYCKLRLPPLNYGERLLAQLLAAVMIVGIGAVGSGLMYGILYFIPIKPFIQIFERICCLNPGSQHRRPLRYVGGWLFTSPEEEFTMQGLENTMSYSPNQPEERDNHTIQEGERLIATHSYSLQYGALAPGREPPVNGIPVASHNRGRSGLSRQYGSEKSCAANGRRGVPKQAHVEETYGVLRGAGTQGDSLSNETATSSSATSTGVAGGRLYSMD